ncbi:hypothetical protein [Hymenobacter psychrophilus]|uniref:hypothetical protein n=1 Tax=Hymenobacter psychrophilus TaxID=651662 RepID=UPI000B805609|nr:hypothetical protein [Hymenobacter psychrophilus]
MKQSNAKITTDELKSLLQRATAYLEGIGEGTFDLETDYYAIIPTDDWEKLEQPQVVIGSLFDDVAELKRAAKNEVPFTSVDLDRLASLLRAISQHITPL